MDVLSSSIPDNQFTDERVGFEEIGIGRKFYASEVYTHALLDEFEQLSGDHSPFHAQTNAAAALGFPDRVVYGFLMASLLSRIVGTYFRSGLCVSVSLDFVKPVFVGEEVQLIAEIAQIQPTLKSAVLKAQFMRKDELVARGKLTTQFL
jgi:3-hydroxybutyryl-CoA dehydratase